MGNLFENYIFHLFLFASQIVIIYLLKKKFINLLFFFLRFFLKTEKLVYFIITLFFFPGTIIHEFSHYFMATLLFLQVKEIKIFPEIQNNQIKLGHVLYYKKDFIRSILVGVSPFFGALLFFFFISFFHLFPSSNFWQNLFFGYLVFVVSSTMFSSKQDLIDLIYIIPLFLFLASIIYIFNIKPDFILHNQKIIKIFLSLINSLNFFLFISLLIHLGVIFFLNIVLFFLKKNKK